MFETSKGFLRRLCSDTAGNTLAIVAAALIPITAMIGSGLDLSRAYMAKSRLQSACDAASLAARRVMRNDALTDDVVETGEQFFNFNFQQGMYQTQPFEPEITRPDTGLVRVSASTRIPTVIMKLFGFDSLPLNVSCDASLNFVNTDVVLVLDVTGSMLDSVGGTPKIEALQDAVMALYDELAPVQSQLQSQGLRLRYGMVPYSSTVNVGRLLYDVDPDYIRDSTPYQSRVANFNTATYTPNEPTYNVGEWQVDGGTRSSHSCKNWVEASPSGSWGSAPSPTNRYYYQGSPNNPSYDESTNWGWSGADDTSGSSRSCRRWRITETTTYSSARRFTNWTYREETYDTSLFKRPDGTITLANNAYGTVPNPGGSFNAQQLAATGLGVSTSDIAWNGCIEERDTVSSITSSSGFTIPADAFDLNINLIPEDNATRWRPMLPEAIYTRSAGTTSTTSNSNATNTSGWIMNYTPSQGYSACPSEAARLDEWTRDEMDDYVMGLQAVGGTYHDIGMIWGARFISTGGVFADGCEEYNGMPCNRHLIFMTDGAHTTYCNVYTAYGIEQNDMRTTGSGSCPSQLSRHQQRFQMICNATKNMNVSVWVIAFDTSLSSQLISCASNASQASTSSDRDQLIARFRQIGNQIGALRLTK